MTNSIIKTSTIGTGTKIGNFCVIGENVKIGRNCNIHDNVIINGYTTIGDNTSIFSHSAIGNVPQDLKYSGEKTELIIGNNNIIREFAMFNPGTGDGGTTIIGNNNFFMAYVHVAHDCKIGNDCILTNGVTLGGHISIDDDVNIGGMTAIHQFVNIGSGSMVAGASAISQDIPPYCIAEGNRATIRGLNKHKMRKIFNREEIDNISHLYRILLSGEKPIRELANDIFNTSNNSVIRYICRFILDSKRGIPYKRGVIK